MSQKNGEVVTGIVIETKKTMFYLCIAVLGTMFALGWLCNSKRTKSVEFTYEEIQMVEAFREQLEDEIGPKAEVIVCKDKNGNLMLSWK